MAPMSPPRLEVMSARYHPDGETTFSRTADKTPNTLVRTAPPHSPPPSRTKIQGGDFPPSQVKQTLESFATVGCLSYSDLLFQCSSAFESVGDLRHLLGYIDLQAVNAIRAGEKISRPNEEADHAGMQPLGGHTLSSTIPIQLQPVLPDLGVGWETVHIPEEERDYTVYEADVQNTPEEDVSTSPETETTDLAPGDSLYELDRSAGCLTFAQCGELQSSLTTSGVDSDEPTEGESDPTGSWFHGTGKNANCTDDCTIWDLTDYRYNDDADVFGEKTEDEPVFEIDLSIPIIFDDDDGDNRSETSKGDGFPTKETMTNDQCCAVDLGTRKGARHMTTLALSNVWVVRMVL